MNSKRASRRVSNKNQKYEETSSDSSDDEPLVKQKRSESEVKASEHIKNAKLKGYNDDDGSSSDSSLDNCLKASNKIDLNSPFFDVSPNKTTDPSFESIAKKILSDVDHLSDSESSENELISEQIEYVNLNNIETSKQPNIYEQIENYQKQLEDTKQKMVNFNKSISSNDQLDIKELLAMGEKSIEKSDDEIFNSLDELDSDSDLEEVKHEEGPTTSVSVPKDGVQITVELPNQQKRKSKEVDMMAVIKRKINRVKKEYQVYVHKVHLLCWIAHGNYVNATLNNEKLLGLALSLIPSQHCYPDGRITLSYIEQITNWYTKIFKLKPIPPKPIEKQLKDLPLLQMLQLEINKKEATSNKDYVLIFICILRSLGIQCRLILSFRAVPLRPPASELCSLSKKEPEKPGKSTVKSTPETKKNTPLKLENGSATKKKVVKKSPSEKTKSRASPSEKIKIKASPSEKTKIKASPSEKTKIKASPSEKTKIKASPSEKVKIKVSPSEKTKHKVKEEKSPFFNQVPSRKMILSTLKVPQVDGFDTDSSSDDSCSEFYNIPQTDGANDCDLSKKKKTLPKNTNLAKLRKIDSTTLSSPEIETIKLKRASRRSVPLKPSEQHSSDEEHFQLKTPQVKSRSKSTTDALKPVEKIEKTRSKSSSDTKQPTKNNKKPLDIKLSKTAKQSQDAKSQTSSKKQPTKRKSPAAETKSKFFEEKNAQQSSVKSRSSKPAVKAIINILKGRMYEEKEKQKRNLVKTKVVNENSDSDSDYATEEIVTKRKKKNDSDEEFDITTKTKIRTKVKDLKKRDKRVLSTDDDNNSEKKKGKVGNDVWIEVFVEEEEKWISVDVVKGQVHCVQELSSRASQPLVYVVAWNNNGTIKDVTSRYCKHWNTVTRKLRVEPDWWKKTLKPYMEKRTAREKEEDEELARQQLDQPLPTSIAEFKDHPLYALKRHLLKFQAIYPPDAPTIGFIRNEAVYPRDCVYTLHSRETWVKQAKVVKPGEKPYKIVKARPKYDRLTGNVITDIPLEIFGVWQVKDYEPPVAENGVVPRNAYGNVELFKSCMLPIGTVHLRLPSLNKVARKLRIDCAPAVVGWDFHSGGSHPTFDGFVVCEEFEQVLIDAWHQEQEEAEKRAREKIEKRVYDNWRRLIKGLWIRERLKARYDFGEPSSATATKKKCTKGSSKCSKNKRRVMSSDSDSDDNK